MSRPMRAVAVLLLVILPGGCVAVPHEAGFADVRKAVADRTGQNIQWRGQTTEDTAADHATRALLQRPLTADTAVQVALLNNRSLQATYEELGIAQAEVVQAGLLKNPVFEFDPRWSTKNPNRFSYELTVTQDFLDILYLPMRKRVAQSEFEGAKLRVAGEVVGRAAEVRAAFHRYQAAEQLVEMHRNVTQATEASRDVAQRLREAGNVPALRLHQEQALHGQAKLALAEAEAEALDAREELNKLMGLWGGQTGWTVEPRLPELPQQELGPSGLESLAVAQRLDLAAAKRQTQALAHSLGLSRFSAWDFTTGVHAESEPEPESGANIGPHLEGSVPLFDQGQAKVAQARARLRQSQQQFAALAVEIRGDVRRARNRMLAARDRAAYYRAVMVPLRQRVTQETLLQYNAMQVGALELLQTKQEEIEAGQQYIQSLRDYWLARAELERAVGGRLPGQGPASQPATEPATRPPAGQEHEHQHGTGP